MNNAIHGDDGGKGNIKLLADSVASLSTPAKTVNKLLGSFSFCNDSKTPGLALAAAQPQTEFTTITEVPDFIKSDTELNSFIISINEAAIKDGGEGAILIKLKKL